LAYWLPRFCSALLLWPLTWELPAKLAAIFKMERIPPRWQEPATFSRAKPPQFNSRQ
jgi:hypothetical protein